VTSQGSTPTEPLLTIDGLGVRLGGATVLDAVDATAERGRFVGVVGPNGAGKTTLLRTIAGAITPDAGRVTVDGQRIHDLSSRAASRLVASVPQDTTVAFEFDVRTVVEMGRNPHRSRFGGWTESDAAAVDRALDRTDVREFADRGITTLSGGERQRVLLARALAQDAPLLLLDEPTGSLDINHQVRTLDLVSDLVAEGRTALAAIHDLDLAARYCDELLLLSEGRIVAAGPPEAVLTESAIRDAFDATAVVAENPVTGTMSVTALGGGEASTTVRSDSTPPPQAGSGSDGSGS
jgi:iron complex transport system ATP-binding protein